jgi:hypothetical protein
MCGGHDERARCAPGRQWMSRLVERAS